MQAPINTIKEPLRHLADVVRDATVVGGPNAVDLQEFQGQTSIVKSDTLPIKMTAHDTRKPVGSFEGEDAKRARSALERWGVRFLSPVDGDPLFQFVELPAGWKKVPTDHSQLSMLVDGKGRERARIFFKSTFYDRKAALILQSRYGVHESLFDLKLFDTESEFAAYVTDGGVVGNDHKTIHITDVVSLEGTKVEKFRAIRNAIEAATAWLDTNYPEWQDPIAYWD